MRRTQSTIFGGEDIVSRLVYRSDFGSESHEFAIRVTNIMIVIKTVI